MQYPPQPFPIRRNSRRPCRLARCRWTEGRLAELWEERQGVRWGGGGCRAGWHGSIRPGWQSCGPCPADTPPPDKWALSPAADAAATRTSPSPAAAAAAAAYRRDVTVARATPHRTTEPTRLCHRDSGLHPIKIKPVQTIQRDINTVSV